MIAKSARPTILALCIILQWSLVLAFPDSPLSANSSSFGAGSPLSNSTKSQNGANSTAVDKKAAASASVKAARAKSKAEDDENWAIVRAFVYLWLGLLGLFTISLIILILRRYIRTV